MNNIHTRKTNTIRDHSDVESKKVQCIETESRLVVPGVGGLGEMGRCWSKDTNFPL